MPLSLGWEHLIVFVVWGFTTRDNADITPTLTVTETVSDLGAPAATDASNAIRSAMRVSAASLTIHNFN